MERSSIWVGTGGQGVQLAANVVARAAVIEGRQVSVISIYGGEMRGGKTITTVVFADGPIESPPLVSRAWSVVEMHPRYWGEVAGKVANDAFVLYNANLAGSEHDGRPYRKVALKATDLAKSMGNESLAAMVLAAAYAKATGIVSLDSAKRAMTELVPSYRRDRVAANERALEAGYAAVDLVESAWVPGKERVAA